MIMTEGPFPLQFLWKFSALSPFNEVVKNNSKFKDLEGFIHLYS